MKIAAIISEYNPFTSGHAYHIRETKALTHADAVVCIMSGNFVQRGEPAMFDKQFRTRLALEGGADVVFELPTLFALQTAELFAFGAVKILDSLGCMDYLSFGTESEMSFLLKIASLLADEPYSFKKELNRNLDDKQPFAQARSNAIAKYFNLSEEEKLSLSLPNSILAIEYIKKLMQFESTIQPVSIHRVGAAYRDETTYSDYMSATALGKAIKEGNFASAAKTLPAKISKMLSQQTIWADNKDFFQAIRYALLRSDAASLKKISGITEGLENSFVSGQFAANFDELVENVHSKRYTKTSVQRMIYNILLGITAENIEYCKKNTATHYARVLGFRQESSGVIKYISEHSSIPVITNVPAYKKSIPDTTMFDKDILASDVYQLCTGLPASGSRPDFKLVPIIRGNDFPELS